MHDFDHPYRPMVQEVLKKIDIDRCPVLQNDSTATLCVAAGRNGSPYGVH